MKTTSVFQRLLEDVLGVTAADEVLHLLRLDPATIADDGAALPRAAVAVALNAVLFADLLERVVTARAYVEDLRRAGERVTFDHGALRTVRLWGPTGELPPGQAAFGRLLEPLGYRQADVYPLTRLGMTGYAYRHLDYPETIPQFFVSELHVERFSPAFQAAAERVFGGSVDALGAPAFALLQSLATQGRATAELALAGLPGLVAAFSRRHPEPRLEDYETLLAESPEAAWIATEGNAFNHATDRVPDVAQVAQAQRARGRPMKPEIETSRSGRVRQTALRADPVVRRFRAADGGGIERTVPGSFYEFISRDPLTPGGPLDLAFDSANAQGIFKMTASA